jgi:tRNA(Met) cytidine acetyltransferase
VIADAARALREEAVRADERRLLALAGDREAGYDAARAALSAAGVEDAVLVGPRGDPAWEQVSPDHADRLLGTTREAVAFDAHATCEPNALGQTVGVVDGGGLYLLLCPSLDEWPGHRDAFDRSLAVPPVDPEAVTGRFHARLAALLRAHPGIAVADLDRPELLDDGLTSPAPRLPERSPESPPDHAFPAAAYEACLTDDQAAAVAAFERLRDEGNAVVVEADRGRGKSSAAGIAAGCLAAAGDEVTVTAPDRAGVRPLFERARALRETLGAGGGGGGDSAEFDLAVGEGRVRYRGPTDAAEAAGEPDALVVDEAAGLPVRLLDRTRDAERVAYTTTVHGYEGACRGFDVRFREHLADGRHEVTEARLAEPVRYAAGDPVEPWVFRALMLDARPPVDQLVGGADPGDARYERLPAGRLASEEGLLREAFGLLVTAHYRTEPNDLMRVLDAPNVSVRALLDGGHVAAVALLAREGGLDRATRDRMYDGARVAGNMLPDMLTSQLRDPDAAVPAGQRVLRIATHPAIRSRGFGTRLLEEIAADVDASWLGVGYGATPELVRFWGRAGFSTVHLSTTRNDTSGEYSAVMLRGLDEAGRALHDRHARWFVERAPAVLADALADLDPDVVRAALSACGATPPLALSERDWRVVAGASYGPGLYDVDPEPFRRLAVAGIADPDDALTDRQQRLLVRKVLQAGEWAAVADELEFHSTGECMRALGDAYQPLLDRFGDAAAHREADRYRDT